ncbi:MULTISPECIES: DUF3450 domain-containing protein [Spongiibacter]|jgi:hypothetical protein|uniref:DUF3450 domain-containing protein n=1 Tax=Spongiibacter TaxID=630749 RepID=UPI00042888DF|nr:MULTISPECIES: DUF3450 domain-containing protein [Spongiibacter]MAK44456.1 DUF3450 domain-containing protein [Spongiibacter sp.]MBM7421771.1 hypothetical protein [Spongiibacter marinus]|tara:strand:+ start:18620 stop:19450 length:831 start_codon:yes stop_codon:yes gene_type:complete
MKMHRLKSIALAVAATAGVLAASSAYSAEQDAAAAPAKPAKPLIPVSAIVKVGEQRTKSAKASQVRIDRLAAETGDLLQDYKTVMKQVDGLRVYNARLEKQIAGQLRRIASLEKAVDEATIIQRQIDPLIQRMIDGLEQFVELDVPFHLEERKERIEFLRNNLDRSDITIAEKFRQVLEAYKIENEYGRKIDSYKGVATVNGAERDVNFLRIGRIGLLYQTTDGKVSGAWDKTQGTWTELDAGDYRGAIQKGLRIARKQASIDIMKLPIPAPEAAK